ncbi:MAG: hypothetical protein HYY84_11580 [Deltaproteobacteria bacterium]|nr:hypothetical protein [Deltaproteobacteria bacterium]
MPPAATTDPTRALVTAIATDLRRRLSRRGLALALPTALLAMAAALFVIGYTWREIARLFAAGAVPATAWSTFREWLYFGFVAASGVISYNTLAALFRAPWVRLVATLPAPPHALLRAHLRQIALAHLPLPIVGIAAQIPLLQVADPILFCVGALLFALGYPLAILVAIAFNVAAARAVARGGSADLSGGWVPAASAPFLYTPALALATTALLAIPLQRSLEIIASSPQATAVGLAVIALPIPLLYAFVRSHFSKHHSAVLPTVFEADSVGTKAIAATATASQSPLHVGVFGALLPPRARAAYAKDALISARRYPAGPVFRFLASLALFALAIRHSAPHADARIVGFAFALVALAARLPISLADALIEPPTSRHLLPGIALSRIVGRYFFSFRVTLVAALPLPLVALISRKPDVASLLPYLGLAVISLPAIAIGLRERLESTAAANGAYASFAIVSGAGLAWLGVVS